MNENTFRTLALVEPIQRALVAADFHTPTPIQQQAIPLLLEGHDLLGCAQTGSGKTAAFGLPMLQHLATHPRPLASRSTRALILAPTRELAQQISDSLAGFARFMRVRLTVVVGGVNKRPQTRELSRGVDILVATPGRLLDLMGEGWVNLGNVEIMVLDEADRMLDMGFIPDVERILATLPQRRQSLFFSATMPAEVSRLARGMLRDPRTVDIAKTSATAPKIDQGVLFVDRDNKRALLAELLGRPSVERALVFTRTKHRARDLARVLVRAGFHADALHGDKSQSQRQKALDGFHDGSVQVLVATDIAARGLDVDDIDHVINYELPNEPESYIHRIGRTARAGKKGIALSLCDASEVEYLRDIEKLLQTPIAVRDDHGFHSAAAAAARAALDRRGGNGASRPSAPRPASAPGRGTGYRGPYRSHRPRAAAHAFRGTR